MISSKIYVFRPAIRLQGAKQLLHGKVDKKIVAPASQNNISQESVLLVQSRNGDLTRRTLIPYQFTPKGHPQ